MNVLQMAKIMSIVGARPQFIKAAIVSSAIKKAGLYEILVHTGQHYDDNMSSVFFGELGLSAPTTNLGIGSGSHGYQTAKMLIHIEDLLKDESPDLTLVYGDTNSTLAGALASCKLNIPVAHVEAGLRSFNKKMPEEHNRVITDHVSTILFCPTVASVENLKLEGITEGIHKVGDVMLDAVRHFTKIAEQRSDPLSRLQLKSHSYILSTIHRSGNTDDLNKLTEIFTALDKVAENKMPVIVPLHPRTNKQLGRLSLNLKHVRLIRPISYFEMLVLEKNAHIIITDSGGVQKEAYWFGVPCITIRNETEWVETVEAGCNTLAEAEADNIIQAVAAVQHTSPVKGLYGNGNASELIAELLTSCSP